MRRHVRAALSVLPLSLFLVSPLLYLSNYSLTLPNLLSPFGVTGIRLFLGAGPPDGVRVPHILSGPTIRWCTQPPTMYGPMVTEDTSLEIDYTALHAWASSVSPARFHRNRAFVYGTWRMFGPVVRGQPAMLVEEQHDLFVPGLYFSALLALPAAVNLLLVMTWVRRRARRHERVRRGACGECGYDLRASPGRCPECGVVPMLPGAAA
jgi:hypothetical protein